MNEVLKKLKPYYFMIVPKEHGFVTEEMALNPSDWSPHEAGEDLALIHAPTMQYVFVVPQEEAFKTQFIDLAAALFNLDRASVENQYPFINGAEELSFNLDEFYAEQWRKERQQRSA